MKRIVRMIKSAGDAFLWVKDVYLDTNTGIIYVETLNQII